MHIGICGYAESGKDAVADILVAEFGYTKVGMSDALDKYLLILDPIIEITPGEYYRYRLIRDTYNYVESKKFEEVRRLLQRLGTDVGRAIDPDIWVKEWRDAAELCGNDNVVVTGIRFQNEIDMVDKLVWVNRPGVGPKNDHVSEDLAFVFEQADYMVSNSGTLENLRDGVINRHEWFTKSER